MAARFSIIVPTWNRADSVLDTLQSCFQQSYANFELLLIDDGSTDETRQILASLDDPRLRVVHQKNAGPAAARNHGMRIASGDYIAFLDADDRWYPEFLETADRLLQELGDVLLYGQIIVDRGVGRYWIKPDRSLGSSESIFDYLYLHGSFIQTSTIVIPRSLAETVKWDESLTFGDNDQFAIDCWRTGIAFHMLPRPLTLYCDLISDSALSQLPITAARSEKYTNFFDWMQRQSSDMSPRALAGFRARFESTSMARSNPLQSLGLLWQAWRAGAMSPTGMLRQCIQNFFPRSYRRLVDRYVALRGITLNQAREP